MQYTIGFALIGLAFGIIIGYIHGYCKAIDYANQKLDDLIHYSKYE